MKYVCAFVLMLGTAFPLATQTLTCIELMTIAGLRSDGAGATGYDH